MVAMGACELLYLQYEHLRPADDVRAVLLVLAAMHSNAGHAGHRSAIDRRRHAASHGERYIV